MIEIKRFKEHQKFEYRKYYTPIGRTFYHVEGREKRIFVTHHLFSSPFGVIRIDITPMCK